MSLQDTRSCMKDKLRKNWNNYFQRWLDENIATTDTTIECGEGVMCRFCDGDVYRGKICVRTLRAYLKSTNRTINYAKADFLDVWTGDYWE